VLDKEIPSPTQTEKKNQSSYKSLNVKELKKSYMVSSLTGTAKIKQKLTIKQNKLLRIL